MAMDMKNMNLLGIIAIIGAVILIVGVFLTWLSIGDATASGWKVYTDGSNGDLKYTYVPLLALICGIISLVLMIVPTFMNVEKFKQINMILGIIALILAIVVVICGILFYTQSWTALGVTIKLTDIYKIGIGFWLVLIGGIITMVGGLMPIIKEKLM
jgi:amino acid transporter